MNVDNLLHVKGEEYNIRQLGYDEMGCNNNINGKSNRTYHSNRILNEKISSGSGKQSVTEDCIVKNTN